jgi:hypothetical protein
MPVTYNRIHRHLGIPPGSLTFRQVAEAAESGLRESGDLDWKVKLPDNEKGTWNEFAKDVVAFANGSGGVLVYGVADTGRILGVEAESVSGPALLRLRQLLDAAVQPYPSGIAFEVLSEAAGEGRVLLLVSVEPSEEAPHFVYLKERGANASVVPLRIGDRTVWMDERQIAEAYSRRFDQTKSELERLRDHAEWARDQACDEESESAWLTFVAMPSPRGPAVRKLERHEILGVGTAGLRRSMGILNTQEHNGEILRAVSAQFQNPRVGLKRWVLSNTASRQDSNSERPTFVEIHDNGTTVLVINVSWGIPEDWVEHLLLTRDAASLVEAAVLDQAAAEFVALATAAAEFTRPGSSLLMRADLTKGPKALARYAAIDSDANSRFIERTWSRRVRRVQPVLTEVRQPATLETWRMAAYELASGILHQFGMDTYLGRPADPQ